MIIVYSVGNSKIGIGNVSRSSSLFKEFLKNNLVHVKDIHFVCEASPDVLKQFQLDALPRVTATRDKSESFKLIHSLIMSSQKKCLFIVDAPNLSYADRKLLTSYGIDKFIFLTDNNVDVFQPDFFIDTDIFPKKYSYDFPIEIISGSKYHIMRDDLLEHKKSSLPEKQPIQSVFVCFGGADPAFYTEWFYENIALNNKYSEIHFTFALGPSFSNSRVGKLICINDRAVILKCPNMVHEILNHDLVITLGGLTTYEAMYIGTPVCAIEWSYMAPYVRKLHDYNYIENLGAPERVNDAFERIIDKSEVLFKKMEHSWRTLDGLGAERVVKYMISKKELMDYFD
ncbi:hypothetical protein LQV63_08355 [Paenibacillus profundus]|uniref:Glycosyl transferase family 28 C-terminal domain-containing protein n=1 Tax=Paenibacillus profundus TaxID=1173085 RepID=A0ABS8YCU4_9BACL|nr:hypothetical protein [Paenibacillus profundus]MCE5169322.1 hypothetical protein [Paenibacillus profundus]